MKNDFRSKVNRTEIWIQQREREIGTETETETETQRQRQRLIDINYFGGGSRGKLNLWPAG